MNKAGINYLKDITKCSRGIKFPKFTESRIYERLMRMGIEHRDFELLMSLYQIKEDAKNI